MKAVKLLGARWFVFAGLFVLAAEVTVSYGLFRLSWWAVPAFWAIIGVVVLVSGHMVDKAGARMPRVDNVQDALWLFAVVVIAFAVIVVIGAMWIVSTIERRGDSHAPVLTG
ncbi:MAG TPA: hypothetical protein VFT49_00805 [Candidatus Saccharimonadales bacterium]|nr:hypothetical protein [Candidatus Saccharimonadales bacterium]